MMDEQLTQSDYIRLTIYLLVGILVGATFVMSCRDDARINEKRIQCESTGRVWYREGRQCLDIKSFPIEER